MNRNSITRLFKGAAAGAILMLPLAASVQASSHREAPLISQDPLADNTDVYAFRSPNNPNTITLVANYIPMQLPHGGPNYYFFGEDVRYEIHVDNNTATPGDDIIYRFTFKRSHEDPTTFFKVRLGQENNKNTYTLQRSINGGSTFVTIISNGVVPAYNAGPRTIQSAVGLNQPNYMAEMNSGIMTASTGEKVFAGPVDDPFFVDLGGIFDLGDAPRTASGAPRDGLACKNVHSIVIQVPISTLQKDGKSVAQAANILDSDFVIGVWASASRRAMQTLNTNGTRTGTGAWVQVSRLGMPLTNEAVIPVGQKDAYNRRTPYNELPAHNEFFYNPELALYMDPAFFASAVPAFSPLRIQKNSLGAFGFGNTQDGLFSLKNTPAVAGTALGIDAYEDLLLPGPGKPRSVDLWPIFHTGVPNLAPYQLATGKPVDNPLAVGKPFINNFLPTGGDMLRLNMAVPVTPRNSPDFSTLGLIQAAALGLTDSRFNQNASLQNIPNMDGFPNGRRLEDDVTRIELQAVAGVVLAAIGLPYDDYVSGPNYPLSGRLVNVLGYTTGVESNDTTFMTTFPYVAAPWSGTGACSGEPITYVQPAILAPTQSQAVCMSGTYTINSAQVSGGTNFQTFTELSNALNFNGICGPVVINVAQNSGPYTSQFKLSNIPGTSAANTITINGNGNTLTATLNKKYDRAVITLDSTDRVTINNLIITVAAGSTYGWGIHLLHGADFNTFNNVTINTSTTHPDNHHFAGIVATNSKVYTFARGNNANNLTITNSMINGGRYGIRINGSSATPSANPVITGNTIMDPLNGGIYLDFAASPVVGANTAGTVGNMIMMRNGAGAIVPGSGIYFDNVSGSFTISRNEVQRTGKFAVYLRNSGTAGSQSLVSNNMIGGAFQTADQAYGLTLENVKSVGVYYNSVNVDNGAEGAAFLIRTTPASSNVNVRNNSFAYTGSGMGVALMVMAPAALADLDNNNYFSTDAVFASYNMMSIDSLQELQAEAGPAGHDANSQVGNPNYASNVNLHATGAQLNNQGTAIAGVTIDFDGQTRSSSTPDIGADEYSGGTARENQMAANGPVNGSGLLTVDAYPNPFQTSVMLKINSTSADQATITITDVLGRLVKTVVIPAGSNQAEVNLQSEPRGFYVVKVLQGQEHFETTVVKE